MIGDKKEIVEQPPQDSEHLKKFNFVSLIKRTSLVYRMTFSDGMYEMYWEALKDFDLNDLKGILIKLSIECKFMPKPYDIAQELKKLISDRKTEEIKNNPQVIKKEMTEDEYLDYQTKRWGYDARVLKKKHDEERERLNLTPQQYCIYLVKHSSFGKRFLSNLGK